MVEVPDHEAFDEYKKALDVTAKPCGPELSSEVAALLQAAAVTKAEGLLLRIFDTVSEPGPLRSKVQSEMMSLRAAVGKGQERKVLHPLLQQRSRDALGFKK